MKTIIKLLVLAVVAYIAWDFYGGVCRDNRTPEQKAKMAADAKAAAQDPKSMDEFAWLYFRRVLVAGMEYQSSYEPIFVRAGDHPRGRFYYHEYKYQPAGNGVKVIMHAGLLYTPNESTKWTIFGDDECREVLREVNFSEKK